MAYEEKSRGSLPVKKPHDLTMEGRRQLSLSGVEEVESFDEKEIVMRTVCGTLIVRGEELSIGRLSTDAGDVSISGLIVSLSYEESAPGGKWWSRLLH